MTKAIRRDHSLSKLLGSLGGRRGLDRLALNRQFPSLPDPFHCLHLVVVQTIGGSNQGIGLHLVVVQTIGGYNQGIEIVIKLLKRFHLHGFFQHSPSSTLRFGPKRLERDRSSELLR
jgi:hypothetical protein